MSMTVEEVATLFDKIASDLREHHTSAAEKAAPSPWVHFLEGLGGAIDSALCNGEASFIYQTVGVGNFGGFINLEHQHSNSYEMVGRVQALLNHIVEHTRIDEYGEPVSEDVADLPDAATEVIEPDPNEHRGHGCGLDPEVNGGNN